MEQTVAILALSIMALGLITVIIGLAQFVKMLASTGSQKTTASLPAQPSQATAAPSK